MEWTVETVSAVDAEIEALPVKLRARLGRSGCCANPTYGEFLSENGAMENALIRLLETVENVGLEVLREPHVKHLDGKLWELRVRAEEGIARGVYVTAAQRRVVVLHVFAKKSRKTPRRALATARERMKQVTP